MLERNSIFAADDAFEERLIKDETVLRQKIEALKTLGQKIVLTSGSFDLPHIGHMRYLREARKLGHCLVVGIDSDEKVRRRKGEYRPIIPELERAEMIAHSRYADIITIKDVDAEQWSLIKLVRPDILVVSERNEYDGAARDALAEFCGHVTLFESQATTSTSASVRKLQMESLVPTVTRIRNLADEIISAATGGDG